MAESLLQRIAELLSSTAGTLNALIEAVRTTFSGSPEIRRKVAFSIALIALSAKMAKADGVVTPDETRAFHDYFAVPPGEMRNVSHLYNMARKDVAGFEAYAGQIAALCGGEQENCSLLEDVLDALFHVAKADGVLHSAEEAFLARIADIFRLDEAHYEQIRARHVLDRERDPYAMLGIVHGASFDEVKRRYRQLVAENHPDRLQARGVPAEFLLIATRRLAAYNVAYEQLEKVKRRA